MEVDMTCMIAGAFSRTAAVVITLGAVGCGGAAAEQQVESEGKFTVNFTSIHLNPQKPVAISKDRDMGVYVATLTTANAAGKGLLHNLTGRCLGWFIVDKGANSYEQHGQCNFTDADGDLVYERYHFEPQPLGSVRIATGKWTGGSGKYEGLRGEFEIRVTTLKPAIEGVVQAIGTKEGRFWFTAASAR
jgi:hypothetical protein